MLKKIIRPPVVAGMFYPKDREELIFTINKMLDNVDIDIIEPYLNEKILGFIAPHAGYIYSGQVAAYTYKLVQLLNSKRKIEIVVVLSPSHREPLYGSSVYNGDYYSTPLGEIKVSSLAKDISNEDLHIYYSDIGHSLEHALEVQLPFLQVVLGDFQLIPIVIGDWRREHTKKLSQILREKIYEKYSNVLFIASTDLSHFYPYDVAKEMDLKFLALLEQGNIDELEEAVIKEEVEACGIGPVFTLCELFRLGKESYFKTLYYANSGDVIPEKNQVVGYGSGVFIEKK